jgi:DNA-binding NarL/FixJ family response regulator
MNGIEATSIIKNRWPDVKVIILTTFQDIRSAAEAISLGAEGYLLKSVQPKHLAEAIRIVHSGGTLVSMETAKQLVENRKEEPSVSVQGVPAEQADEDVHSLTDKEIEIVQCLAEGMKYKDIAGKLHFSESTIKNYVSIIYSKLNVENRTQAVRKMQKKMFR